MPSFGNEGGYTPVHGMYGLFRAELISKLFHVGDDTTRETDLESERSRFFREHFTITAHKMKRVEPTRRSGK